MTQSPSGGVNLLAPASRAAAQSAPDFNVMGQTATIDPAWQPLVPEGLQAGPNVPSSAKMKIPLTYGTLAAIASSLLTLLLFFLGYHSDASKLSSAQPIMLVGAIVINVGGIFLGMRASRSVYPPEKPFSYGRALGVGVLVGATAALLGSLFGVLYSTVINPEFMEVMLQQQTAKLEAAGMSGDQIEKATGVMRMMLKPAVQFALSFVTGLFWGTLMSLIVAAFVRRPATAENIAPPLPSV